MNTIKGTVRDHQVILAAPLDWPDGTEVEVVRVTPGQPQRASGEEPPETPEQVEEWLR